MNLKTLTITGIEDDVVKIYLDGEEITNVSHYKLEHEAGDIAELTLTMYVNVGQIKSLIEQPKQQTEE